VSPVNFSLNEGTPLHGTGQPLPDFVPVHDVPDCIDEFRLPELTGMTD
jgi:hypothetical protein